LHHYFPALYFGIIAFCQIYDFVTRRIPVVGLKDKPIIGRIGAVVFLALSVVVFTLLSPLAYGNTWTKAECTRVKLFGTWDWDCNTFLDSYDAYNSLPSTPVAAQTPQQSADAQQPPAAQPPVAGGEQGQIPIVDAQKPLAQEGKPLVSGAAIPPNKRLVHTEERVEYRDQDGNLLNEEQVKALEGKVEFKTRYETRTRVVDAQGNEILLPAGAEVPQEQEQPAAPPVAPPHPDVEGVDRETPKRLIPDEEMPEPKQSVEGEKEREGKAAKPASEGNEATAKLEEAIAKVQEAIAKAEGEPKEL
jgi:dolichyl-phosphate-mannose-protein mannosyltransferase